MAKSRASARQRAASRRAKQRRQRQLVVLLVVAGVAILFVAALILLSQRSASLTIESVGDYSGFPQGVEEDGSPYIGEPDAPVTLTEYSDFACPHCATFSETAHRLIDTYVADGSLKIVYKPMSFVNPQTSPVAAAGSLCAAKQGMFWEMHDALFGVQRTYGSSAFTQSNLIDLAGQIGLNKGDFSDCLKGGETRPAVRAILAEAQNLGVNSTPTLMVNGQFLEPGVAPYDYLEGLILDILS